MLGGGLPVGALAAVVIVLVVTRRRHRHPMSAVGGESTSGIATPSDAECDVMNNRRATSPSSGKTRSKCDYVAPRPSKELVVDALSQSTNHVDLAPGRCAKVSNVERQRSSRRSDGSGGGRRPTLYPSSFNSPHSRSRRPLWSSSGAGG